MNINHETLGAVSAALADLDVSEENARIAELEGNIADAEQAMKVASERRIAISGLLQPYRGENGSVPYEGTDGAAVADALLLKVSPSEAAASSPTREQLQNESDALGAGMNDLRQRAQSARNEIDAIRRAVNQRVFAIVEPLAQEIETEAQQAAETVLSCWAALAAIATASRSNISGLRSAENAIGGFFADRGLLRRRPAVEIPGDVAATLGVLADKGKALPVSLLQSARPENCY